MNRRHAIALIASFTVSSRAAFAESVQDEIIDQLKQQGYMSISISHTLLGRIRIIARSRVHIREIILNPRTGEILRDYWHALDGEDDDTTSITNPEGNQGPGGGNDDDSGDDGGPDDDGEDDEDDEDDEEDEEDERDEDDEEDDSEDDDD